MSNDKTAIIVGAGVGGCAIAARLAKAGFRVTVLEKNAYTGGRCSLLHHHGHRFDQGPSLLLLPHIFRTTFTDLGTSLEEEGVELLKCEPNYLVRYADGETIELSTDLARMKAEVEKWEGKDGFERYLGFLSEAHRHYELSVTHVLNRNFYSLLSMLRPSFLSNVVKLHPFHSLYSRASKYFATDRLRRAFTFASMYMGPMTAKTQADGLATSPFDAPGTYSLLQYTELTEGIWYPRGGFHKVIEVLVHIAKRHGAHFLLSTPVSRVLVCPHSNRATGVLLASGDTLSASLIIINADLVYAHTSLLPLSPLLSSRLSARASSCSSISFYWSLNRPVPELGTHTVFLAEHYEQSFDAIFKQHAMPGDPSFYVNVPSRVDPSAAPEGRESVVVLVPVGHLREGKGKGKGLGEEQDWEALVERARGCIFERLGRQLGLTEFREWIAHEMVNTPVTWKSEFNLDKGAILGIAHDFFNVLSFRPATRHPTIKHCYFVGASTHPGTGVPIVLAGAKLTADQILADFGMQAPWPPSGFEARAREGGGAGLDVMRSRGGLSAGVLALLVVFMALLVGCLVVLS